MVFRDDSSYRGPSTPITVYTVLNMSGICSWVCIHITVGSSFHTTITTNFRKNLVFTCLFPESGPGVWVEVWVRDFGEKKNKEIEREKEWSALILQPRGEVLILGPGGNLSGHHLFHALWLNFLSPFFVFLSRLLAAEFSNGFPVWSWIFDSPGSENVI